MCYLSPRSKCHLSLRFIPPLSTPILEESFPESNRWGASLPYTPSKTNHAIYSLLYPPFTLTKSVTYHPGLFVTYHRIVPPEMVLLNERSPWAITCYECS